MNWNEILGEEDGAEETGVLDLPLYEIRNLAKQNLDRGLPEFFSTVKATEHNPYIIWDATTEFATGNHRVVDNLGHNKSQACLLASMSDIVNVEELKRDFGAEEEESCVFLRADNIIGEHQIWECQILGLASFVLRPSNMNTVELQYLIEVGRELRMEPLLKCQSVSDLKKALKTDGRFLQLDFEVSANLRAFYLAQSDLQKLVAEASNFDMVFSCEISQRSLGHSEAHFSDGFRHFCYNPDV